ncbi:MAG: ATP-binding protein [Candidatus Saccharimonadales bacterium]
MGGQSTTTSNKYALMVTRTIRRMSVMMAFVIVVYAILAELGFASTSPLYSSLGSLTITTLVVVFALWTYVVHLNTKSRKLAYFVIPFHALGMAFPVLISGFMSPIVLFWIVLIVVTGSYFGKMAATYSAMLLIATAMASLAVTLDPQSTSYLVDATDQLGYAAMVILLSIFILSLRHAQTIEHADMIKIEEKRTNEQSRLMTLINSLNEAIISVNAKGTVQFYNAATLNLLDTNQSLTGKKLNSIVSLNDKSGEIVHLFKLLTDSSPSMLRDDLSHTFEDGEQIHLAISGSKVRGNDNELLGYILVLRDVTREKSLEEERDEFISVVSHELRTPITITEGTISNVQLLIDRGASPAVVKDSLVAAHEQTIYLSKMINDLSTLSRAERNVGSETERINVVEFAHEIFKDYQSKAAKKNLLFNLDITGNPGYIKVSRLYLEEILQNFLTNAIKYTQKGSIDFVVHASKGQVKFSVKDSGIGISKKEHAKIFDKFYRSEDYRTRETNGTGLGLYIVHKLARKLDTKIELESRLNHGSTFSVSIPLTVNIDTSDQVV